MRRLEQPDRAVHDKLHRHHVRPGLRIDGQRAELLEQRTELQDRPRELLVRDTGAEHDRRPHNQHGQSARSHQFLGHRLRVRVLVVVVVLRPTALVLGEAGVGHHAADERGAQAHQQGTARALPRELDEVLGARDIGRATGRSAQEGRLGRAVDDDVDVAADVLVVLG